MRKTLIAAGFVAVAMAVSAVVPGGVAVAKSEAEVKAQLEECKKLADPKAKDECVKKVGQGAETSTQAKERKTEQVKESKTKAEKKKGN